MSPFVRPVRRAPHPEADFASPAGDGLRPLEEAKKAGPREARELSKTFFGRMAVSGCTVGSLASALDPDDEDNAALADVFVPPTPPSKAWRASRPPAGHRRPRPARPVPAADAVRQEMTQSQTGDALGVSQMHAPVAVAQQSLGAPAQPRRRGRRLPLAGCGSGGAPTMTGVAPRELPAAPAGADGHDETVGTHHAAVVQDDLHGPLDQNRAVTGERHTRRRRFIVHVRHGSPPALPSPRPGL